MCLNLLFMHHIFLSTTSAQHYIQQHIKMASVFVQEGVFPTLYLYTLKYFKYVSYQAHLHLFIIHSCSSAQSTRKLILLKLQQHAIGIEE